MKQVQCKQAFKGWKLLVAATEAWHRACSTASPLPLLPLCHLRRHLQSSGEDLPGWQAPVWPGRKRRTSSIATESKLHFIFSAPARCLVPTDPPLPSLAWSTPRCNFDAANSRLQNIKTYLQADMALSALYLHNVNHRAAARPSLGQLSGYTFQVCPSLIIGWFLN